MRKIKIAVAMSGGVDSGVAAALLVKAGYQVTGIHMKLWRENKRLASRGLASSLESAKKTAEQLGIPFEVLDFSKVFKKQVVDYFLEEYKAGRTPNPCVRCNKFIKFGELLDYVRKLGFNYLATGHYARIASELGTDNLKLITYHLLQAVDKSKDQSYFLYNLTQKQLAHILFPVGDYTKKQVRQMAKKWNLPVAERPESQEICFLAGKDYREFLKKYAPDCLKPGEVVDTKRRMIGHHFGLPLYTIGQRHGFTLNTKYKILNTKLIPPYYVIRKDILRNRLIVGFGKEAEVRDFGVNQVNLGEIRDLRVRVRSQGELLKAKLKVQSSKLKVILNEPERGIAAGQAAVFYKGEEVLGGGTIIN